MKQMWRRVPLQTLEDERAVNEKLNLVILHQEKNWHVFVIIAKLTLS